MLINVIKLFCSDYTYVHELIDLQIFITHFKFLYFVPFSVIRTTNIIKALITRGFDIAYGVGGKLIFPVLHVPSKMAKKKDDKITQSSEHKHDLVDASNEDEPNFDDPEGFVDDIDDEGKSKNHV